MTEPIRCPRCRRSFGGHFTWRRAHPNGRCRTIIGLRAIGLRPNGGGVWHRLGPQEPRQLSLFKAGRPRGHGMQYRPGTENARTPRPRVLGRPRHETLQLRLFLVAA